MCFVGFNFVPNLIVILFNLLYPVFIVRFNCMGCERERERERESVCVCVCVKTQVIEDIRVFVGSSRLIISRKDACALHMTRMRRVVDFPQLLPLYFHTSERLIAQTLTHPFRAFSEVLVLLGSIGRSQGWQMQHGACCRIRRARQDMVPSSLVGVGAWRA